MVQYTKNKKENDSVSIKTDNVLLEGNIVIPKGTSGIVLFVHGSGSSRFSPRNSFVAKELNKKGVATLLFDLLTRDEEIIDEKTANLRFDIELLARRLVEVTDWVKKNPETNNMNIGYFGASTGAAAALVAAAERSNLIKAVVSRGGRPDLGGRRLAEVRCPTLLIVGGCDEPVIAMNRDALAQLKSEKNLVIVPGATHLFEEKGTLEEVSVHAGNWFQKYLGGIKQK